MSKVLDDVLAANQSYVEGFGDKGSLALPPARRFAILTCMDSCGPLGVLRKVI